MKYILAVTIGVMLAARPAAACSCMAWTPEQAADATGVAYVGRVVAVSDEGRTPAGHVASMLEERTVDVEVVDPITGVTQGQPITLTVLVGPSASCGMDYPFVVGDQWLFFDDGSYRLTLCAPDRRATRGVVQRLHARYRGR
jgi:hypothetical protein